MLVKQNSILFVIYCMLAALLIVQLVGEIGSFVSFQEFYSGAKSPLVPHVLLHMTWQQAHHLAGYEQQVRGIDKFKLIVQNLGLVFNSRSGCIIFMHLLRSIAIRPNLELKTCPNNF